MTMIRPAAGLLSRLFDSVSLKTAAVALISVTAWHFTDAGDIKANRQAIADEGKRQDTQGAALVRKVDRDTYQRDQEELYQELHEIRLSEDQIKQILMERGK